MASPYVQHSKNYFNGAAARDVVALIARVLLVALFIISGLAKVTDFAGTVSYIAFKELPMPELAAVIAIAVEVLGGLLLLFGWRTRATALVIAIYTLATALLFHAYWADAPADRMTDFINFWKNVSIAGGFLMVFACGAGRLSIEGAERGS